MRSVCDTGPFAPCPQPFNMAAHVLAQAEDIPDKIALSVLQSDRREDWTYAQIARAVRGIASGFQQRGLRAGDRILLRLGNTPETPLAYLAAIAVDMVPVPTSSQLTAAETRKMIDQLDPALILHDPASPCPDHPRRCDVSVLSQMKALPPAEFEMGDPNRLAYIVFTSGTSGQPRAVMHAHRAIWARQMMLTGWYDLHPSDRVLHAGAFNWTYTMGTGLMDPWSVGATALIPAPGTAPDALPALILEHKASIFAAAPGIYRKIVNSRTWVNTPELRHGLAAGEKLKPDIRCAWQDTTGTPVFEAFGMSECSTFISACPAAPVSPEALGRPQPGRRVAILDDTGAAVPRDTQGMIAVHRSDPGLMLGYLDAQDATRSRFRGDWFVTGDLALMRPDDTIVYLGRADDMMNAGGYRVSPVEVEAALSEFPGLDGIAVTDIAVKPDVRVIMAFYTAPTPASEDALHQFASTRLARYKTPRAFHHIAELPTGPNGKLARRALQHIWETL